MDLKDCNDLAAVTAQAEDFHHNIVPLTIEHVGKVPNFEWLTQLVIKLPDALVNAGDVWVSIKVAGLPSNKALVRIKPTP